MIEYKVSNVEAVKTMSKYIDLKLLGTCTNSSFVEKCLTYENIWRNEGVDEVDKQIQCWEN